MTRVAHTLPLALTLVAGVSCGEDVLNRVPDPCDDVVCDTPPAAECLDPTTLVVYESPGTCIGGECLYPSTLQECTFGCVNGACLGDPCESQTCDTPYQPICIDDDTRRVFENPGFCNADGICEYPYHDEICEFGCVGGECRPDPCAGIVCDDPGQPECLDPDTLRIYEAPGVCIDGACHYDSHDEICEYGCLDGACRDAPPACIENPVAKWRNANDAYEHATVDQSLCERGTSSLVTMTDYLGTPDSWAVGPWTYRWTCSVPGQPTVDCSLTGPCMGECFNEDGDGVTMTIGTTGIVARHGIHRTEGPVPDYHDNRPLPIALRFSRTGPDVDNIRRLYMLRLPGSIRAGQHNAVSGGVTAWAPDGLLDYRTFWSAFIHTAVFIDYNPATNITSYPSNRLTVDEFIVPSGHGRPPVAFPYNEYGEGDLFKYGPIFLAYHHRVSSYYGCTLRSGASVLVSGLLDNSANHIRFTLTEIGGDARVYRLATSGTVTRMNCDNVGLKLHFSPAFDDQPMASIGVEDITAYVGEPAGFDQYGVFTTMLQYLVVDPQDPDEDNCIFEIPYTHTIPYGGQAVCECKDGPSSFDHTKGRICAFNPEGGGVGGCYTGCGANTYPDHDIEPGR